MPGGVANKYTLRGSNPTKDGITGIDLSNPVAFSSGQVVDNRDEGQNGRPNLCAVQGQFATAGYTFMHELGHMLGASHAIGDDAAGDAISRGIAPA